MRQCSSSETLVVDKFPNAEFGRQNLAKSEMDPRPEVVHMLMWRLWMASSTVEEVVIKDGQSSLLSCLYNKKLKHLLAPLTYRMHSPVYKNID